ncbi:MAG: nucleoside recognition protein [Clostridia bacterium]|nr:nucleoside recognition protein [Clostridia bacterium]
MINYIWASMLILSFIFSIAKGNLSDVNNALLDGASSAVEMAIGLLGMMCFWSGLLEIAKRAGLTEKLSKMLRPLMKLLFPELKENSPAISAMLMNMVANFLGLSNAATPLGLKAMKELDKENKQRKKASHSMCLFVVINTASITLIPTTVIALRAANGSKDPFSVIVPVWICSVISITVGIVISKILAKRGDI